MRILTATLFAVLTTATAAPAQANDRTVVEAFYTELLSNASAQDLEARAEKVLVEDWVSIPTPRGGTGREGFVKTLAGFGQAIPDLKWEPEEILRDGNRYIVRGKATGTPVKPMFGVEPNGKSFEIMSIDIHTVENGRIVRSYHVEEWLKAMKQLKAEN